MEAMMKATTSPGIELILSAFIFAMVTLVQPAEGYQEIKKMKEEFLKAVIEGYDGAGQR